MKRIIILMVIGIMFLSNLSINVSLGKSYNFISDSGIMTVELDTNQSNDDGGVRG